MKARVSFCQWRSCVLLASNSPLLSTTSLREATIVRGFSRKSTSFGSRVLYHVIVRGNQRRQTFLGTGPIWKGSADIGTKIKDEKVEDKRRVGKTSGGVPGE